MDLRDWGLILLTELIEPSAKKDPLGWGFIKSPEFSHVTTLLSDENELVRAAASTLMNHIYRQKPKVMVALKTSVQLQKMVEVSLQYSSPQLFRTHIQYLHDYVLNPHGAPLRANANSLIDMNIFDVLHEAEKLLDDMESQGCPKQAIHEAKDEINDFYDSLNTASSRSSSGFMSPS
jgi:hypothetical protein